MILDHLRQLHDRLTVAISALEALPAGLLEGLAMGRPETHAEPPAGTPIGGNGVDTPSDALAATERPSGRAPTPCVECAAPFTPKSGAQRYCSADCRDAVAKRRQVDWAAEKRRRRANGESSNGIDDEPPTSAGRCIECGADTPADRQFCSTACRRRSDEKRLAAPV
jgi:predicted nucleic acid-binding Zn ribbon protein